jgi:hypothetical protein
MNKLLKPHSELLKNSPGNRYKFYNYITDYLLSLNRPVNVLETGTMFEPHEIAAGSFTYIMGEMITNTLGGHLTTIDKDLTHLNSCKKFTYDFQENISYVCSDSVTYLNSLTPAEIYKIDLFYLDSLDIDLMDQGPSENHHLVEVETILPYVNANALICVDDNWLPNIWVEWNWYDDDGAFIDSKRIKSGDDIMGKGRLINKHLLSNNWTRITKLDEPTEQNAFVYYKEYIPGH